MYMAEECGNRSLGQKYRIVYLSLAMTVTRNKLTHSKVPEG